MCCCVVDVSCAKHGRLRATCNARLGLRTLNLKRSRYQPSFRDTTSLEKNLRRCRLWAILATRKSAQSRPTSYPHNSLLQHPPSFTLPPPWPPVHPSDTAPHDHAKLSCLAKHGFASPSAPPIGLPPPALARRPGLRGTGPGPAAGVLSVYAYRSAHHSLPLAMSNAAPIARRG